MDCHAVQEQESCYFDFIERLIERVSCWKRCVRVLSWMLRIKVREKQSYLTVAELTRARKCLIQHAQLKLKTELEHGAAGKGRFRKLAPVKDDGLWRVGSRLRQHVPFTNDLKMPVIIPRDRLALLLMEYCHKNSHAGQDGTLCRFRMEGFWMVRAGQLAKQVVKSCVPCRKVRKVMMEHVMGEIPRERLKEPVAWGYCQMDLFGPFSCRGDVNPRTSKKTWGMVIEDVNAGAVHLDIVQDYSTNAVLP